MDRHREDVRPFVEDALRAVAVVDVDVEDRDALMLQPQMRRRDRAVVEETEAAGHVAIGVMAGRTAQRIGRVLAVHDQLRGRRRDIRGGAGRGPGAGADRAAAVSAVCQPRRPTMWVG